MGGITETVRASLTGILRNRSAARKTYGLSLRYNSGLPRALILHFLIHTERCTSHVMGAVSSVSDQCGEVMSPLQIGLRAHGLRLPSPAIPMGR